MDVFCAENFDREMACTEQEWLGWLPQAMGSYPYQVMVHALTTTIEGGQLHLSWRVADPHGALHARVARLLVSFRFTGIDMLHRYRFMKRLWRFCSNGVSKPCQRKKAGSSQAL